MHQLPAVSLTHPLKITPAALLCWTVGTGWYGGQSSQDDNEGEGDKRG